MTITLTIPSVIVSQTLGRDARPRLTWHALLLQDANGVPAGQQKSMLCHEAKAQTPANEEKKDNEEDEYGDDSDF